MILDRLVIAGLAWTGHVILGRRAPHSREKVSPPRTTNPSSTVRMARRDNAPAETQEVIGPDQDMLQSLNIEESMGFGGLR